MKVAVLIELYRQVHEGRARLDELLTVRNEFHSLVDGSLYHLDPSDDSDTDLYRAVGVEDSKAFAQGLNNTTSARALLVLLEAIAHGEPVDADSSRQMLAVLELQTANDRIPAGLPRGIRVAHKTGEITAIRHDAAIVFARRPFVLVVLTRGVADPQAGSALIADIARELYNATQQP